MTHQKDRASALISWCIIVGHVSFEKQKAPQEDPATPIQQTKRHTNIQHAETFTKVWLTQHKNMWSHIYLVYHTHDVCPLSFIHRFQTQKRRSLPTPHSPTSTPKAFHLWVVPMPDLAADLRTVSAKKTRWTTERKHRLTTECDPFAERLDAKHTSMGMLALELPSHSNLSYRTSIFPFDKHTSTVGRPDR